MTPYANLIIEICSWAVLLGAAYILWKTRSPPRKWVRRKKKVKEESILFIIIIILFGFFGLWAGVEKRQQRIDKWNKKNYDGSKPPMF